MQRIHRQHGALLISLEVVIALGLLAEFTGGSIVSPALRQAIWGLTSLLGAAATMFLVYKIWVYAKEDLKLAAEQVPPWRLMALVALLAAAIASIWWAPKLFQ